MVFHVFYNGYHVEKRFSQKFLTYIYRSQTAKLRTTQLPPDLKECVDWHSSTRKQLYVLNKHVYEHLLRCSHRYYWPDGRKFVCRHYKHSNETSRNRRTPTTTTTTATAAAAITSAAVKNCQCDRKPLRCSKVIKVDKRRRRLSGGGDDDGDGGNGSLSSTLRLLSSPVPADNWCDELEIYARNNGYDESPLPSSSLEEGELLDGHDETFVQPIQMSPV
ncbi:lef-6 [Cyclophragma undans nucleopolyhedrovirus]|uniref:Lef-6 n=1 Tax=Cyclophragma undans nucleopolyhedrovirus TaxID=1906244 RepID=A0A288Q7K9_9ABAC|nr:lef-6 [Cyclophragma undans nucleopolyhedrovirus]AOT85578.1 lef-6 [Cyclophragma undans nucleopolyhedrovirus]